MHVPSERTLNDGVPKYSDQRPKSITLRVKVSPLPTQPSFQPQDDRHRHRDIGFKNDVMKTVSI